MKKVLAALVTIGSLVALGAPAPASAQKAPKNAVVLDADVGPTSGGVTDLATVTLRRFKKNRILRVEVSLEVQGAFSGETALLDQVRLNGHLLPFESTPCSNTACFVERTTFVDLDVFAASFPDDFKGEPLEVVIRGRAEWEGPPVVHRLRALVQLLPK